MSLWPLLYAPLRVIGDLNDAVLRRVTPPPIQAVAKEVGIMSKYDRRHYDSTVE